MNETMPSLEEMAARLDASGEWRTLRRFKRRESYTAAPATDEKLGVYLDVETTGLDTSTAEIIELAFVLFSFDRDGHVYNVGDGVSYFNDPGMPIPLDVVELTGITDNDVAGHDIPNEKVFGLVRNAALVVAHNADFDRRIIERRMPWLADYPWACSYREVDWKPFGCACGKLEHILMGACREFYEAHRALDDCRAGVHALAAAQHDGRSALSYLLESARQPTIRIWAARAPFEVKDLLKSRGYRWHDGTTGRAKCWYLDVVGEEAAKAETEWLWSDVQVKPDYTRLTARERYSLRADR